MAAGLAAMHLAIYTVGYLNTPGTPLSAYLLRGVAIALVALLFAVSALALTRMRMSGRWRRAHLAVSCIAAVLLTVQALLIALGEPGLLIQPAGPGPWSLIGGPAFAVLSWNRSRRRQPNS
jgi:hypothetical protein